MTTTGTRRPLQMLIGVLTPVITLGCDSMSAVATATTTMREMTAEGPAMAVVPARTRTKRKTKT